MSEDKKIPEGNLTGEGEGPKDDLKPEIDTSPPPSHLPTGQAGEQVPLEVKADASQPQSLTQHSTLHTQHNHEMEVHHHGHVHEKKKWKEYLFQFLMLFLAVFCGFLAEYQLEHKIERDREKQYMKGMLEDLVSDTAMLGAAIQFSTRIGSGLDSLQKNFFDTDNVAANTLTIYRQNTTYLRIIAVGFSDQTAIQLRNSGAMRLIREREIANAISRYWRGINSIENVSGLLEKRLDEISEAGYNIFNTKNIIGRIRDSLTRLEKITINPAAELMTRDNNKFINYANRVYRLSSQIDRFLIPFLKSQKLRADSLIHLIKKEYHLD
jgi:hypothetical protein